MKNNKPQLNDPKVSPTINVLKNILKDSYSAFEELSAILIKNYSLTAEWKYYRDSKAWLCKVSYKKKTIFWLAACEGYFQISFYFLERHLEDIAKLNVKDDSFVIKNEWGKMIPLVFKIYDKDQFSDLLKIINYKKSLK